MSSTKAFVVCGLVPFVKYLEEEHGEEREKQNPMAWLD
jgi:hypothetical protein